MSALSLPDAKAYLNIVGTANDVEIQDMIDAAEAIIGKVVGPLTAQAQRTDRVQGANPLVLPVAPVVSVSAISVAGGAAVDVTGVTTMQASGLVYVSDPGVSFGQPLYDVTYIPGRSSLSADLLLAVKEMVRHLWKTQRGSSQRGATDESQAAAGYLMPYRVEELIEPYRLVGVGAA